ncbi:hypothetical protein B0A53_05857 [Rhodotorula sp. CCFEE 5036]|nr:hypothetical protein B0A53_05857 [Rhodotorula sp. CCFEE 5036]
MAASDATDKQNHDGIDSARIGWAFLSQYYSFLNKDPARLHCFYTKRSTLLHSTEGEDATACYGQQEIHAKIMSLQFEDCKVYISNVDSQSSAEGGILVQVIGEMSNANGPWRKFAQTFFLAGQHNGYFVLNDICRYIKEEGDEGTEAFVPPRVESSAAEVPASALPPAASVESVLFDESHSSKRASHAQPPQPAQSTEPAESETRPEDSFTFHSDVLAPAAALNGTAFAASETRPDLEAEVPAPSETTHGAEQENASHAAVATPAENAAPETETPVPVAEEEAAQPAPAAAATAPPAEAAPAPVESAPAETVPESTGQQSTGSAATPSSATGAPSAAAPPSAPAAPKSWASLAAAGSNKWGKVTSETKGVSAAVPQASPSTERATPSTAGQAAASPAPFTEAVMAVKTPSCFVKGVVEAVTDQLLKDTLTSRFGPLKELDIVRSKACAFIEFEKLDHARKAIQVSMRPSEGGEGAIFITAEGGMQHRINVVERKPHDQRPVSKRGGGAMGGADRGGFRTAGSTRDGAENASRTGRNGGSAGGARGGRGGGRGGARGTGAAPGK